MQKYVLIVAGGKGSRFDSIIPKQFALLNGRPILMHTFEAFSFLENVQFVLVLADESVDYWKELCEIHQFKLPHQIASGGPHRFHSVKSGLRQIPNDALVAIHDSVRPLVSKTTILGAFEMAERKGNGIPTIAIHESVREIDGVFNKAVDRNKLQIIQTPQVFKSSDIKEAYNQNYQETFTDDASVAEQSGEQIYLTKGNPENIKITSQLDLVVAEKYMGNAGN